MTGYTVHTGTSKKFISGWDRVFSGKPAAQGEKATEKKAKSSGGGKKKTK